MGDKTRASPYFSFHCAFFLSYLADYFGVDTICVDFPL